MATDVSLETAQPARPRKALLVQLVARREEVRPHVDDGIRNAHKTLDERQSAFTGLLKTYAPHSEEAAVRDTVPPEGTPVQIKAWELLDLLKELISLSWDTHASIEHTNTRARATVHFPDGTVLEDAPAVFLLWFSKQLTALESILKKLPTLPADESWTWDDLNARFQSAPKQTARGRKETVPLVLSPATDKFPAQVEKIQKEIEVGLYTTIKYSGALPPVVKTALLERLRAVRDAVNDALHEANTTSVEPYQVAGKVWTYLLAPVRSITQP